MRERRILYLDDRRLSAYRWRAGEVHGEGRFAADADGLRAFAAYLLRHARSRFTLLVNGREDSFRVQTIPRLAAGERSNVIERKLTQHFPGCPYTASLSLGHERSRRREECVLLAALLAPERLDPWIEAMREAGVALCGIHSLALLGAALLGKVVGREASGLLLTMQDDSLRESYFERGRLRFSRLVPWAEDDDDPAQTLLAEAGRLRLYLINQQLIGDQAPLHTVVVAGPSNLPALRAVCADTPALAFELRDSGDCARRVGLKQPPGDDRLDNIYVHLLATTPQAQFAAPPLRGHYLLRQARAAIIATGSLALAASLIFAAPRWLGAQVLAEEAGQAQAATRILAERLAASGDGRAVPADPTPQLDGVVDRYQEIVRQTASPEALFNEIGAALARQP
ncbi:MAG TPA: hypothetical protein VFY24_04350, partial [Azospira sp.]|nr:hypothetical protein [Azospira sp.]